MEILLKQDKRFHLSNDHKYRGKIKKLAESSQSIDITPLVNLTKLQPEKPVIISTKEIIETNNSDSLKKIITRLSELNKKMDKILN